MSYYEERIEAIDDLRVMVRQYGEEKVEEMLGYAITTLQMEDERL